jgi:hypothetical protein
MKQNKLRKWIYLTAISGVGIATIGCLTGPEVTQAQTIHNGPPPTAPKPLPVKDLQSAVSQTAVVAEGRVSKIEYEYTEEEGPWTVVTLSDVQTHLGAAPSVLEIRHFGGLLPDGRMVVAAELPVFVKGKRYIVFLRNTAWNVSPIVDELALRVETVDNREVLVNSDGQPVTEVSPAGIEVGPRLFERPAWDGTPPKALSEMPGTMQPQMDVIPPRAVGVGPDATTAKLLREGSSVLARKLLDRQNFVAELEATLASKGLSVAGTFYDLPAGEFRWRDQRTNRSDGQKPPADTPANAVGGADPEVDTSEPSR